MTFAKKLQELREQAGMTQTQLAEASGLPLGSLRNYEQGQREPYWNVVFKLADALGVAVEVFAECVDDATPEPPRAKGRPRKASTVKTKTQQKKK
jgi:transcriptional regulator with XRE-family HTH domain